MNGAVYIVGGIAALWCVFLFAIRKLLRPLGWRRYGRRKAVRIAAPTAEQERNKRVLP